jgi:rsbT co-antagonist protein RsbR
MATSRTTKLPEILAKSEESILQDWLKEQLAALSLRKDLLSESDLRRESAEFLSLLTKSSACS